jgi:hypothetical protein
MVDSGASWRLHQFGNSKEIIIDQKWLGCLSTGSKKAHPMI